MGLKERAFSWAELGYLPDGLIRLGVRRLCTRLASQLAPSDDAERQSRLTDWVAEMDQSPIALATDESKEQHYEVPSAFFDEVLGPHRKYSSAYWGETTSTLEEAEQE